METGSSVETVREEARHILEEMSQNLQLSFIRLMGYTLSKVFKRLFSSIFVNMEGLNRVRTKGVISTVFRHQHTYIHTYTAVCRAKGGQCTLYLLCFIKSTHNNSLLVIKDKTLHIVVLMNFSLFPIIVLSPCSFNKPSRRIQ